MDLTFDKTALTGNTVLLTGAGGGIGRETALAFAALGAFVLLTDIDRARGEQATAAVNLRFPQAAHFLHADLSDKEAVAALCALGYNQSEAAQAVARLDPALPVEELVRLALRSMAGKVR